MAQPAVQYAPPHADSLEEGLAAFGVAAFRPGQRRVIGHLMRGEDVLALMPTGAGKSLCYQLPAYLLSGVAIVVSPLIALMENQVQSLHARGIRAGMIHSGRDRAQNIADWTAAREGQLDLLYMSPERLMTGRMLSALRSLPVTLIAVDEAHCISQWGHQFRADYRQLGQLRTVFPKIPIAAFTATADRDTEADIKAALFGGEVARVRLSLDRPNLFLGVHDKTPRDGKLHSLLAWHRGESGIVYCRTRRGTEAVARQIEASGRRAFAYHAGLPETERLEILNAFTERRGLVIAATVAFGMGIDKPDIRFVIHRDLPSSLEAYYQEIGRAGRDGAPAKAHLLYGRGDVIARRRLIENSEADSLVKQAETRRLGTMVDFAETVGCHRMALLAHFGERSPAPCGRCTGCREGR
ncbi:DNA helicase RecQ [Parvularcula bermudensis HTCC2503]|uniref:ATP-dependent DNA helicase RecQ n=1 Tax=Parvularcula bermudensis (strain ATCC BAA-594 / HTCC2503 / KCTC 12087) TaxID=314260 RepID=E0TBT3_PARBH|nr:ATP-dependent DNA helicase RecQ [Parvularcula bermudensis]ADM08426.1 DNA helicase RecQ [Parvularcula bermudensis HTCC2503]